MSTDTTLQDFVLAWQQTYLQKVSPLPLFNPALTAAWTPQQRDYFVKLFYHARGHFHDFLWYIGNRAPNINTKNIILKNIAEEFGETKQSHEQLYFRFAEALNVNIDDEYIQETSYLPFLREFNLGHLIWLQQHSWEHNWAAFSAYEKLDNIDYRNLLALAESLGVPVSGKTFFQVHSMVHHYETTLDQLLAIWEHENRVVQDAFAFIAEHQVRMWSQLSEKVFGCA